MELTYAQKLERLLQVGLEIAEVKDLDVLLDKILTEARGIVNADAGSIYIRDGQSLRFSHTQNETLRARLGAKRRLPFSAFTIPINQSSIAGYVAETGRTLNLPNVYELPEEAPYKFQPKFDRLSDYTTRAVLTVALRDVRGNVLGALQIINPKNLAGEIVPFTREDELICRQFANQAAGAIERAQMTRATMMRMIRMAELRDPYETGPHASRVAGYAAEIFETWAQKRGMAEAETLTLKDTLKIAAILHDVGKIAIPDLILRKPGKLDADEYETMRAHTYLGARLFGDEDSELDRAAASVALNHHERWDGSGYPGYVDVETGKPLKGFESDNGRATGKRGAEIPVFGRVVAIADVYDALCSPRCYKRAWSEDEVIEELKKNAGTQFDPEMVDAFIESLDSLHQIAERIPY